MATNLVNRVLNPKQRQAQRAAVFRNLGPRAKQTVRTASPMKQAQALTNAHNVAQVARQMGYRSKLNQSKLKAQRADKGKRAINEIRALHFRNQKVKQNALKTKQAATNSVIQKARQGDYKKITARKKELAAHQARLAGKRPQTPSKIRLPSPYRTGLYARRIAGGVLGTLRNLGR